MFMFNIEYLCVKIVMKVCRNMDFSQCRVTFPLTDAFCLDIICINKNNYNGL